MGLMKVNKDTDGTLTLTSIDKYELVLRENVTTPEYNKYAYMDNEGVVQHLATTGDTFNLSSLVEVTRLVDTDFMVIVRAGSPYKVKLSTLKDAYACSGIVTYNGDGITYNGDDTVYNC